MCGIFGILSAPSVEPTRKSCEGFFRDLSRIVGFQPSAPDAGRAAMAETLEALASATSESFRLVGRGGFLSIQADPELRERLAARIKDVEEWVNGLEQVTERGALRDQRAGEEINRLIVGGRDIAWRIGRDVLKNVESVERLLGHPAGNPPAVLGHGWLLNLVLNNLNRLEVRGRDSAGLAVYVRFPSAGRLDGFLGGPAAREVEERGRLRAFTHRFVARPSTSDRTLLFSFKVAEEVGEMGANVRFLREAIAGDRLFQAAIRANGVEVQALAHTRWASNGVVSLPNCHPVDSAIFRSGAPLPGTEGAIVAVLNGDVDNYQELFQRYVRDAGLEIDGEITTDAKIIPLVVGHHYRRTGRLEEAFRAAFDEFEGSMAIGIMAADRPGEFLFGQKGSGQGLFFGFSGSESEVVVASEMYGVVELTQDYLKAEGERTSGGEIFRLALADGAIKTHLLAPTGEKTIPAERIHKAEITTRDINRGEYPRFLLKEISESVESVRKTLRGKLNLQATEGRMFRLGPETLDPERVEKLRRGTIRRIIAIGQGTAAVAGEGVAHLLRRALAGARHPLEIVAIKATELSGHGLRDDMSDTLVIAVSQSGTTTDTNRTVDLLKDRGAWVIAIVNRRNSDLVYKSHGVLYTSDGRDIEMSVASTKAFYAQNVAGQVLALALAEALEALPREAIEREARALAALPAAMAETLALSPAVRELAERHALRKPYWAVVGSGPGKIAADEIRIKLSELCYKSIASDFLEDKKHIDLSSEPLVLVAANDTSPSTISDCVKEVSIFKAHRSVPLVIAEAGETRFDPYAAGVISVPRHDGALSYLLATIVGHLFGYHAAASFDRQADLLRSIRARTIRELSAREVGGAADLDPLALPEDLVSDIARLEESLKDGSLDSGLRTATAVRLSSLLQVLLGRQSLDLFVPPPGPAAGTPSLLEAAVLVLTAGINELSRPIDAIKHQAKTVTVGISRIEEPRAEGALWAEIRGFNLAGELAEGHRAFLSAFEPLVARVVGATLYRVAGLDPVGRPRQSSTIRAEKKVGTAQEITSRCESELPLTGTKWGVVKSREAYLGYGQNDGRKILILPIIGERREGHLLLCHIELVERGDRAARLRALSTRRSHFERLKIAVTERNLSWDPALIDHLNNEQLFLKPPEEAAEDLIAVGPPA